MLRKFVSVFKRKDKSKPKAENGTSAAAPVDSTTTAFRQMPKTFIPTTPEITRDMNDTGRLGLLEHNLAAFKSEAAASGIDVSPEAAQRAREALAARVKAKAAAEARAASPAIQVRANQARQPVAKEPSFFSSFCGLFTCCCSARRKAPKEERTSLLRNGIN